MITDLLVFIVFLGLLLLFAWPLGNYMAKVYSGEKTVFDRACKPVANMLYRLGGVDATQEMNWRQYAGALVIFNVFGMAAVFGIQISVAIRLPKVMVPVLSNSANDKYC